MLKKFFLSFFVVGSFIAYSIHIKQEQSSHQINAPVSIQNLPANSSVVSIPTQTSSTYKDGTYTGSVADAFYGNIQVKTVISGGKITDVVFLQYPNDRSTSVEINTQAMPYLKQEAIQVQSANVDIVSGATDSSIAFKQSLGNALSQANL